MNTHVDKLNETLIARLPGDYFTVFGIDKVLNASRTSDLNIHNATNNAEYLHSKTPSGMPPYRLHLKKGTIVTLMANLDLEAGLCNGTRMQLLDIITPADPNARETERIMAVAKCRILNGKSKGKLIKLVPTRFQSGTEKNSKEVAFERLQLPLSLLSP